MENINSVWGFIGIIVFACGVYAIYSYIKMKKDGEINASILLGKDFMYKEAYIKKVGPALLGFGLVAIVYGILDMIHCYVYPMAAVDTVGMIVFFVALLWFAVYTARLRNQYF